MRRLLAIALLVALAGGARAERLADGVAAQVGSDIVLVSEVVQLAAPSAARAMAGGARDEELRQIHVDALEQLIERALIRQVVKRAEIGASEAEIDQTIEGIAQENGITPEEIQKSVAAQGMPYDVYRERIRDEIERMKVLSDVVSSRVRISESEVRALYEEELARQPEGGEQVDLHLIVVPATSDKREAHEAACRRAGEARTRIAGGEPFEAVAREISAVNPEQGGAQGWVHESVMAGWMRSATSSLAEGQLSEPIPTDFGCALVRVNERRSFVPLTYEKARPQLENLLREQRMSAEYQKFIEKIRAQTYIERKGVFSENAGANGAASFGEGF